MENENKSAITVMAKEFKKFFDKKLKKAQFDKTFDGTVTSIEGTTYGVLYDGIARKIKSNYNLNLRLGDKVKIRVPLNNYCNVYIELDIFMIQRGGI